MMHMWISTKLKVMSICDQRKLNLVAKEILYNLFFRYVVATVADKLNGYFPRYCIISWGATYTVFLPLYASSWPDSAVGVPENQIPMHLNVFKLSKRYAWNSKRQEDRSRAIELSRRDDQWESWSWKCQRGSEPSSVPRRQTKVEQEVVKKTMNEVAKPASNRQLILRE